jgi:hypothetical protein
MLRSSINITTTWTLPPKPSSISLDVVRGKGQFPGEQRIERD